MDDDEVKYAFDGNVIRLTEHGFKKWRKAYPAIPDLYAELQHLDDFYTNNPPEPGTWFIRASNWLKKENSFHFGRMKRQRANADIRGSLKAAIARESDGVNRPALGTLPKLNGH